jgi:hypothetical protein
MPGATVGVSVPPPVPVPQAGRASAITASADSRAHVGLFIVQDSLDQRYRVAMGDPKQREFNRNDQGFVAMRFVRSSV